MEAVFRYTVKTLNHSYDAVIRRGILRSLPDFLPATTGKIFTVTTRDVWELHGKTLGVPAEGVLFFPGGESRKRMAEVEALAEQMLERGADRSSLVVAFGGGIVGDVGGFLAAVFMRGVPVIQVPTTLLAQVDAAVGGKTGVNLVSGKNLVGSFHQPLAVLIDPDAVTTLPEREYRAGLYEIVKCGVIRDASLFDLLANRRDEVMAQQPAILEQIIAAAVRIKAEVVSADEKENGLRRILNFGHTVGHALEAETGYIRFLHGEAVAFGMHAATHIAEAAGTLTQPDAARIHRVTSDYGPIPSLSGISASALLGRLAKDKKTIRGSVHFVLPTRIGETTVVSGLDDDLVLGAIEKALAQ